MERKLEKTVKCAVANIYSSYAGGGENHMLLLSCRADMTQKSGFACSCLASEEKAAVCVFHNLKGFGKLFIAGVYGRIVIQCGNGLLEYEFFAFVRLVYLRLTYRDWRL